MTDKELQRLGRRDLLQLLLDQAKETEDLRTRLAEADDRAREMDETFQRLRERLDEKDAKIREMGETYDRLRDRLNAKDAKIKELNESLRQEREGQMSGLAEMGSIAEAALRLNGIFDAAQKAADLYLQKVQESHPASGVVVADVVIDPVRNEGAGPSAVPPFSGTVVDVEPKVESAPPPPVQPEPQPYQAYQEPVQQPVYQQQAYQQPVYQQPVYQHPAYQQPVQPPPAQPEPSGTREPQRRGLFQRKKRKDSKGKFVFSFGWEQDE